MKAILITYSAKDLSKSESSKLSKALIGYIDKSNKARYTYKREGLIKPENGIIISKSTFIVKMEAAKELISFIQSKKGKVTYWEIDISKKYFKK